MNNSDTGKFEIFGLRINRMTYESFLSIISEAIEKKEKKFIAYANAHTLNMMYEDTEFKKLFLNFDIIHPDGIGIYMASRFLYGEKGLDYRITGSDFYELLIKVSIKKKWSYFFFGHDNETLECIKKNHPELIIKGVNEGYHFDSTEVLGKINNSDADILIVGLSSPRQEIWMSENKKEIKAKIVIAVGDGIKVFAGNKTRGPEIFRKAGLEWFFRFLGNPSSNFKKYIIGNPLFVFRVIKKRLNYIK